jgi:hypothetical protein
VVFWQINNIGQFRTDHLASSARSTVLWPTHDPQWIEAMAACQRQNQLTGSGGIMVALMLRLNIVSYMARVCYQMMSVANPQINVSHFNILADQFHAELITWHLTFVSVAHLPTQQNQLKVAIK